ncbi:MAG: 16S rRNA (cytosine(1402)-N(4))-methyltransferase RsmH [Bacteroidetes bacterium]|nr:16S rRNA (cytosine(1402)-N(4))-methyltransferase RsmH [Bacteroidota bacterium]
MYHKPVLLNESIDGLSIKPDGTYVDVTFGGGGHSRLILSHLESGRLLAFDQDEDALANVPDDERFVLITQNFKYLKNFLRLHNAFTIDGILADLGISSHQIDNPERGFSTRFEGDIDFRMDRRKKLSGRELINTWEEEELLRIFAHYGEVPNPRKLANNIINYRQNKEIITTSDLKEAIGNCAPRGKEFKYQAQVFQALRIEVNGELDALKELLKQATEMLAPGGRLVVLTYHSLEDRLVKNFIKTGNFEGKLEKDFYGNPIVPLKQVSRKPIIASEEEITENNRARSAKLRIAEKI